MMGIVRTVPEKKGRKSLAKVSGTEPGQNDDLTGSHGQTGHSSHCLRFRTRAMGLFSLSYPIIALPFSQLIGVMARITGQRLRAYDDVSRVKGERERGKGTAVQCTLPPPWGWAQTIRERWLAFCHDPCLLVQRVNHGYPPPRTAHTLVRELRRRRRNNVSSVTWTSPKVAEAVPQ